MADLTFTGTFDDKISPALAKVEKNVAGLNDKFSKLGQALAGLAIGSFVQSTIRFADSMQDLSNASNIAVNNIVGLSKSFQLNGGTAEQAKQAIIKLSLSVAEAANGGKNAQLAFKQVNVSLQDIASLSEQDILAKTIEGLSRIEDPALRLKTAVELLGKGAKGIDFTGVAAGYKSASQEALKYNEAIAKVAQLNDKLESAFGKLQLATMKALEPLADAINKLDDQKINEIINSFVQMATALTAIAVAMKGLEWLGRGLAFIAASVALVSGGFTSLGTTVVKTVETFSQWWRQTPRFAEMGGRVASLGKAFGELGSRLKYLGIGFAILSKGFLGVLGVVLLVNDAISALTGKGLIGWLGEAYDKMKAILGLSGKGPEASGGMSKEENDAEIKRHANRAQAAKADEANKRKLKETTAYYADQAKTLEANTQQFKLQGEEIVKNLKAEAFFNTISEDTVEVIKAQTEAYKRANDEVTKLQNQRALLKPEETELIKLYDMQIAKIQQLGLEQGMQATAAIIQLQAQRDAQDKLNHSLEMKALAVKSDESLLQLQEQLNLVGKYGDSLKDNLIKLDVERELRSKLNDIGIKQLELENQRAKLGEENFQREMSQLDALRTAAMTYADARLVAEEKIVQATRNSERMDVGGAVAKRMEELQRSVDPTVMAIQKIDSVTQNMNSAIDKFVDTGKFSFADFSRSIIQDIIKIELKAQATKLFSSLISTGGSFLSGLLGFANGGQPPVGKPSIVGENGPELFVPKTAGTIVPNGGGSGAGGAGGNTYITNNISAVDAKSVAQLFAENRRTLFGTVEMARKEMSYGR